MYVGVARPSHNAILGEFEGEAIDEVIGNRTFERHQTQEDRQVGDGPRFDTHRALDAYGSVQKVRHR